MKIYTLTYDKQNGWSEKNFPPVDSNNTLVIVFGSSKFINHAEPIAALRTFYKHSKLAGCSTAGEIYEDRITDDSLSVAVIQFEKTEVEVVSESIENPHDSYVIGKRMAAQLHKDSLKHVIIFSDGIKVNGTELARSFVETLPGDIQISGGLAGDGSDFKRTWVIDKDKPVINTISAVGLYGDKLEVNCASKGGWDIFGPERMITKSKGNVVYEIDGEPALDLYKRYLGDRAQELPASALLFPLSIRKNVNSEEKVVRTVLAVDEKEKTMTFAGDVPEGWAAQLMRANLDRLIEGAGTASAAITAETESVKDSIAIAVSCVGRRLVLGERTEEEVEATLNSLPSGTKQIGFYSYGEIAPDGFQPCTLHNQTMTLTRISEK
ncbi:MAG: FIST N-terminal domain-containing protein [Gammaproteobacteria bacterium]